MRKANVPFFDDTGRGRGTVGVLVIFEVWGFLGLDWACRFGGFFGLKMSRVQGFRVWSLGLYALWVLGFSMQS